MKSATPKKIFIVDDSPLLAQALTDYLMREVSHTVTIFHTGEDCLKHLDDNPDVIVLDYHLNSIQIDAANEMAILQVIHKKISANTCHHAIQSGTLWNSDADYSERRGAVRD